MVLILFYLLEDRNFMPNRAGFTNEKCYWNALLGNIFSFYKFRPVFLQTDKMSEVVAPRG
jgi:hypothetical protein